MISAPEMRSLAVEKAQQQVREEEAKQQAKRDAYELWRQRELPILLAEQEVNCEHYLRVNALSPQKAVTWTIRVPKTDVPAAWRVDAIAKALKARLEGLKYQVGGRVGSSESYTLDISWKEQ